VLECGNNNSQKKKYTGAEKKRIPVLSGEKSLFSQYLQNR